MTQTNKTLTREDMTELLYIRAEEIFLLCAIITRRGIAHAFCELIGHVGSLQSRVYAADTIYEAGTPRTELAETQVSLNIHECLTGELLQKEFDKKMAELDTYVSYLDLLIAKNKPVLSEIRENAA